MRPYVVLNKEIGQTPLQAIELWRRDNPSYTSVPLSYAGRLDPMASGKLLVLVGDECKKQGAYRGLDKEYEIEILLGFRTDTGDTLGLPSYVPVQHPVDETLVRAALIAETGTVSVPYPVFSSKTVNGKPLFQYALEGTLESIAIPVHPETIYKITYSGTERIEKSELQARIQSILALTPRAPEASKILGADFRQDEIRSRWEALCTEIPEQDCCILTLRVICASGTYMRSLAERLGSRLGTSGVALSIHRTKIGRYHALPLFGFWSKTY